MLASHFSMMPGIVRPVAHHQPITDISSRVSLDSSSMQRSKPLPAVAETSTSTTAMASQFLQTIAVSQLLSSAYAQTPFKLAESMVGYMASIADESTSAYVGKFVQILTHPFLDLEGFVAQTFHAQLIITFSATSPFARHITLKPTSDVRVISRPAGFFFANELEALQSQIHAHNQSLQLQFDLLFRNSMGISSPYGTMQDSLLPTWKAAAEPAPTKRKHSTQDDSVGHATGVHLEGASQKKPKTTSAPITSPTVSYADPELKHDDCSIASASSTDSTAKRSRGSSTPAPAGSLVDKRVVVKQGKFKGEVGLVLRSGHGFYAVDIEGRGEIMKRGFDLELVDGTAVQVRPPRNNEREKENSKHNPKNKMRLQQASASEESRTPEQAPMTTVVSTTHLNVSPPRPYTTGPLRLPKPLALSHDGPMERSAPVLEPTSITPITADEKFATRQDAAAILLQISQSAPSQKKGSSPKCPPSPRPLTPLRIPVTHDGPASSSSPSGSISDSESLRSTVAGAQK